MWIPTACQILVCSKVEKQLCFSRMKRMINLKDFYENLSNIIKKQTRLGIGILFLMTNHFLVLNIGFNSKSEKREFRFFHESFCVSNLQ